MGRIVKEEQAEAAVAAVSAVSAVYSRRWFIATDTITAAAQVLIESQELDHDPNHVTTRRIGHVLKKMRLQNTRVGKVGKRGWMISLEEVCRWADSYGLTAREITGVDVTPLKTNGSSGSNGSNGSQTGNYQCKTRVETPRLTGETR